MLALAAVGGLALLLIPAGAVGQPVPVEPPPPPPAVEEEGGEDEEEGGEEGPDISIDVQLPPPVGILPVLEMGDPTPAFRDPVVRVLEGEDALVLRTRNGRVGAWDARGAAARWGLGDGPAVRFLGWEDEERTCVLLLDETGRIAARRVSDGVRTAERRLTPAPPAEGPVAQAGPFLLFADAGTLVGYRAATGEPGFTAPLPEGEVSKLVVAPGASSTSLVVATLGAGGVLFGEVDESGFRERWRKADIGDVRDSALALPERGMLVVGTLEGSLAAFRLADGGELWTWSLSEGFRQPPHLGERFLFAATEANTLYAFEPGGGSERWRAALPGRPAGGPLGIGARLLVATRDGLVMEFDPRTGVAASGPLDMGAEIVGVVQVATGEAESDWKARRLYLGLRDGRLAVLGPQAASGAEESTEGADRLPASMPRASSSRPAR